jgi:hypothetical protein
MNAPVSIPPFDSSVALYRWTIALSGRLAQMRLSFQGDLDAFLIFLVFAADTLRRSRPGLRGTDQDGTQQTGGINALSISEITGIPRETARRKLQALITMGCVVRDANGLYQVDPGFNLDKLLTELGAGPSHPPLVGALMGRLNMVQDAATPAPNRKA